MIITLASFKLGLGSIRFARIFFFLAMLGWLAIIWIYIYLQTCPMLVRSDVVSNACEIYINHNSK